jgi:hypothetical protein
VDSIEINIISRVCLLKIPSMDEIVDFLKGGVQSPENGGLTGTSPNRIRSYSTLTFGLANPSINISFSGLWPPKILGLMFWSNNIFSSETRRGKKAIACLDKDANSKLKRTMY